DLIDARQSLAAADTTITRLTAGLKEASKRSELLQKKLDLFLGAADAVNAMDDDGAPQPE
ncbi:hypothetical protein OC834_007752, partial [Tilletia horrida]